MEDGGRGRGDDAGGPGPRRASRGGSADRDATGRGPVPGPLRAGRPQGAALPATQGGGMIDLHNHLLPAIDDGSKGMEETIEFLRIAARDGVRVITATPHMKPGVYDNDRGAILETVERVRAAARA